MELALGTIVVVALLLIAWAIFDYNGLIALRNRAEASWSDIDVQLKRRHDLVANLVETVKGYARHEAGTLEKVTALRTQAASVDSGNVAGTKVAESALGGGIRGLLAVAEGYPELKADAGFRELQAALVALESDLQNARRYYNAVVRDLNTKVQSFPDLVIARAAGFREREFFELENAAEGVVPEVKFGGGQG